MLERIFKIVVLPAPLCPTIPSASPCRTWKLTSRIAHMGVDRCRKAWEYQRFGDLPCVRSLYCFETRSNDMSIILNLYL